MNDDDVRYALTTAALVGIGVVLFVATLALS